MSDEMNYTPWQTEAAPRYTALDAAIKTHSGAGYDSVVKAAEAYLTFLTTDTKEPK